MVFKSRLIKDAPHLRLIETNGVLLLQDIFQLTHRAAKEDEEEVAKQAIEFWCTVAEEEIDIQQVYSIHQ